MGKRSLQHQCWFPESQGGDQVQGEDPPSEEEEVEGVGHHQGVGGLPHEEDLLEEGEDHHPLEGGPLPEGGLPLQGGEAGLEEDQELLQGAPEDLPQGHQEAGHAALQGAGGIHHPVALIHPVSG